jgi:hypothetical protein
MSSSSMSVLVSILALDSDWVVTIHVHQALNNQLGRCVNQYFIDSFYTKARPLLCFTT